MFADYNIKWIKNHILIDDEQGLLIDTGSPVSFHSSGVIQLCGQSIDVPTSIMGLSIKYLHEKISPDIHGLIGTDIISKHATLFNLQRGEHFLLMDDDADYYIKIPTFSLMGLFGFFMYVGHKKVKMIFDTGAPISYIKSDIVKAEMAIRQEIDFSTVFGDFKADIFKLATWIENDYPAVAVEIEFGCAKEVDNALCLLGVDGIIGTELLKHYRIQIKNGEFFLPPQGI
jgi:hypothetical protein